ncbi:DNA invertase Pin-like site-specific DNA recombinase [Alkaliphilus hydrothermalis]|uniref:DNA invertase Pin-like site-specific DNA recombinase n=1 Tax=Alkaliphilus hydrothermalis TaxID=1482730 RepID=A0ABS2NTM7_9FIRM|nr:DNA invertase Pin-like site-specific DNA recombinase [Alkaliphilus hydrothermalis]
MGDNIAIAYLRVSTEKQSEKGSSIDSQRDFAKLYAEQHGLDLKDECIFVEAKPASKSSDDKFDINLEYDK